MTSSASNQSNVPKDIHFVGFEKAKAGPIHKQKGGKTVEVSLGKAKHRITFKQLQPHDSENRYAIAVKSHTDDGKSLSLWDKIRGFVHLKVKDKSGNETYVKVNRNSLRKRFNIDARELRKAEKAGKGDVTDLVSEKLKTIKAIHADENLKAYDGKMVGGNIRDPADEKYRTLYSLLALEWVFDADPNKNEDLVKLGFLKKGSVSSEDDIKQARSHLENLQKQFAGAFGKENFSDITKEEFRLLATIILYQDIFKMEDMIKLVYPDDPSKWFLQHHDQALHEACKILLDQNDSRNEALVEKVPLLAKLPEKDIQCIQKMWEKAVSVPQLIQGESSLEAAKSFKPEAGDKAFEISSGSKVNILQLFRLVDLLDAVGGGGKAPREVSVEATQKWIGEIQSKGAPMVGVLYKGFTLMEKAIEKTEEGGRSIYETFLKLKSEVLEIDESDSYEVTRICSMLRQEDPEVCKGIKAAIERMNQEDRTKLSAALKRFYYYSPDTFQKAVSGINPKKDPDGYNNRVIAVVKIIIQVEAKAKEAKLAPDKLLNLSEVGQELERQATITGFDPDSLLKRVTIDASAQLVKVKSAKEVALEALEKIFGEATTKTFESLSKNDQAILCHYFSARKDTETQLPQFELQSTDVLKGFSDPKEAMSILSRTIMTSWTQIAKKKGPVYTLDLEPLKTYYEGRPESDKSFKDTEIKVKINGNTLSISAEQRPSYSKLGNLVEISVEQLHEFLPEYTAVGGIGGGTDGLSAWATKRAFGFSSPIVSHRSTGSGDSSAINRPVKVKDTEYYSGAIHMKENPDMSKYSRAPEKDMASKAGDMLLSLQPPKDELAETRELNRLLESFDKKTQLRDVAEKIAENTKIPLRYRTAALIELDTSKKLKEADPNVSRRLYQDVAGDVVTKKGDKGVKGHTSADQDTDVAIGAAILQKTIDEMGLREKDPVLGMTSSLGVVAFGGDAPKEADETLNSLNKPGQKPVAYRMPLAESHKGEYKKTYDGVGLNTPEGIAKGYQGKMSAAFLQGMVQEESGFFTAGFDEKFALDPNRPWSPHVHCNPETQNQLILVTDMVAFASAIHPDFDSWFE